MAKIGRNEPCPCGSGKKFKRCCINKSVKQTLPPEVQLALARKEAAFHQAKDQQGLGNGIISEVFNGYRFIAVKSRLHYSKNWHTFHDFLREYIWIVLGKDWLLEELKKTEEEQHPIAKWHKILVKELSSTEIDDRKIKSKPMVGAVFAYFHLSYNLYLLNHNFELQDFLIKKLKNIGNFSGALYETYVAAHFIKAGFELELENEEDVTTSHCEFTATSRKTGAKYSVEAKRRGPHKDNVGVGRQLYNALKKNADHPRVVFIDTNIPNLLENRKEIIGELEENENTLKIKGEDSPPAYVFVTNYSFEYDLEGVGFESSAFAHGFKINDFKVNTKFSSLKEARLSRERHIDMFELMQALAKYREIPSTFDGETPEFAFDEELSKNRLLIGNEYVVPTPTGDTTGILVEATVSEPEKKIYGVYRLGDGRQIICTNPMSEDELVAYRSHPETFFGIKKNVGKKIDDPLGWYDFFYESYKNSERGRLLSFMKNRPDFESLQKMSTEELAEEYCEQLTYGVIKKRSLNER